MAEHFGAMLKRLREAQGWSRKGLAKRTGYTYQYVWEQETGHKPPTTAFAEACDEALDTHGALVALVRRDSVNRRTVSLDEWEALAWEYGHTYGVSPPAALIRQLSADFLTVKALIEERDGDDPARAGYCRVASQLAVITAHTCTRLGEPRQAWRWWRTARVTADASGDLAARMMCRGEEVVIGLYERRPLPVLLALGEEAAAIGADIPTRGTAGLWGAVAQANAVIGRQDEAVAALRQLNAVAERLPTEVTTAMDSLYGWPEHRSRHTESYVYSQLGNTQAAYAAQDAALALYPDDPSRVERRAQIQLHRARCMILDHDVRGGVDHATKVLADLPESCRADGLVTPVAAKVVDAVPAGERGRSDVKELAEAMRC